MNEFLVGLDVGTTSSKAVVYTLDGATVSSARVATPWVGVAPDDSAGMPGTEMSGESLFGLCRRRRLTGIGRCTWGTGSGLGRHEHGRVRRPGRAQRASRRAGHRLARLARPDRSGSAERRPWRGPFQCSYGAAAAIAMVLDQASVAADARRRDGPGVRGSASPSGWSEASVVMRQATRRWLREPAGWI